MPQPPILNLNEVPLTPRPAEFAPEGPAAEQFALSSAPLGRRLGARKLGYSLCAVPPGKAAYPFHSHRENEEMFLVLRGRGELRLGEAVHALREGDVVACPPGGPETAHQIRNTGEEELRYLAVSTRLSPEICDYPDSGKFGVYADLGQGPDGQPAYFYFMGREAQMLDYWAGEGGNPG